MTTASASGEISISAATSSSFPRAIFACSNGQNLQDGELLVLEYPRPDRVRSHPPCTGFSNVGSERGCSARFQYVT